MTVIQVSQAPDRPSYDKVRAQLPSMPPPGLVVHTANELPDGRVQIVDVYDSREQLEQFVQTHLFPAFAAAGVLDLVRASEPPTAYEAFVAQFP